MKSLVLPAVVTLLLAFLAASPSSAYTGLAFTNGTNSAVGTGPMAVAVADLNKDGKPDIVTANAEGDSVSVLLGNGSGTFQPAVPYSTALAYPYAIATADLNGDGILDLAIADYANGEAVILLGRGDGSFGGAVSYPAGQHAAGIVAGDFDKDGKVDIALATTYAVSVLIGNGNGTFQSPASYFTLPGESGRFITAADLNGDSILDLIVADYGTLVNAGTYLGSGVSILLGKGDGTFQDSTLVNTGIGPNTNPNPNAGNGASSVAIGDFNADGKPDLAVANSASGNVAVLFGAGDGTFGTPTMYRPGGASIAAADLDGDGITDLVLASTRLNILRGLGDGTFELGYIYGQSFLSGIAMADFNGDNRPDLALSNYFSNSVVTLMNQSDLSPILGIVQTNSDVILSWPYPSVGFVLESSSSLTAGQWQSISDSPATNRGRFELSFPAAGAQRYFRLRVP